MRHQDTGAELFSVSGFLAHESVIA